LASVIGVVVAGAAALTALAPLEATSLPPPQETRAKDASENSSTSIFFFIRIPLKPQDVSINY
jgi:hypothetical protein